MDIFKGDKMLILLLTLTLIFVGCSDNKLKDIFCSSKEIKELKKEIESLKSKVISLEHLRNHINDKEQCGLQERCAKNAAESFKAAYGKESMLIHYTNHYNNKMNKCFILVTEISLPDKNDSQSHTGLSKLLYDVNEHKEYASFFMFTDTHTVMDCKVLDNHYPSQAEWEAHVKPYMEE